MSTKKQGNSSGHKYLSGYDWGRIIAKAWHDPDFKKRIEEDPTTTIRDFIKTWKNADDYKHVNIFNIPEKPADLDKKQLHSIAEGEEGHQMYHCSSLC